MNWNHLIYLIICVKSLLFSNSFDITPYKGAYSKKELIANTITQTTAKKLLTQQNLHLVGTGVGIINEIEMLGMDFHYAQEVDLSTARNLLIVAIQSYLNEINQNKEIRHYLKNYPFTVNNIEIGIYVHRPDGSKVPKDKLYYLSAINGMLYYYLDEPKTYSRITLHQETYEEALKILNPSETKRIAPSSPASTANQKF